MPVELFKIDCPSCATRLKVSHASSVGQILACPKCANMVKVVAPDGWIPPIETGKPARLPAKPALKTRSPEIDSLPETASLSFEDFDDIEALLTGKSVEPFKPKFKTGPAAHKSAAKAQTKKSTDAATVARPATIRVANNTSPQKRNFILQIGAIVTLLALAIAMVVVLAKTLFKPDPESDASGSIIAAKSLDPTHGKAVTNIGTDHPVSPRPPMVEPKALANFATTPPHLGIPALTLIPLQMIATSPSGIESPTAANPTPAISNLIEQFGDLNSILNSGDSQLSMQELADASGPERGQIGIGSVFVRKPQIIDVDLALRLNDPIPEIAFTDVSLIDALRTLSELSTIPICYELDLIDVEGISLADALTLKQLNTTVGAAIDALLKPRKLKAVTDQDVLLITVADRDEWSARDYDLSIIPTSDAALAETFAKFLQSSFAKASWQAAGGQGTIAIEGPRLAIHQSAPVHALIGNLILKLDAAKRLATQPSDEDARKLLLSRHERSKVARQAAITLNLFSDKRLESVLSSIARDIGTQVLVNWQSLIREGWSPATRIPWESSGQPLEQELRKLTDSMQLTTRVIDGHTLQITTRQDAQRQLEVEVYPCADLLEKYSTDQLLKILDTVLGSSVVPEMGMSVTLETTCKCFVAILPQTVQIRLEAALAQLRRETANPR